MKRPFTHILTGYARSVARIKTASLLASAVKTGVLLLIAAALLLPSACASKTTDQTNESESPPTVSNGSTAGNQNGSGSSVTGPVNEDTVFATLSEISFTVGEYLFFKSVIKMSTLDSLGIHLGSEEEELFWNSEMPDGTTMAEGAIYTVLEELKRFKVMSLFVQENGSVSNDDRLEIRGSLAVLADEMGGIDAFNAHIADNHGISRVLFLDLFEQRLIMEKFLEDMFDDLVIEESEARAEYDDNIMLYEVARVMHILILHHGENGQRSEEESKELARQILQRAENGEDMRTLAFEFSEDPEVHFNSGLYTFSRFDNFLQEFTDWSFAANTGDFGIVETSYGYHVMKLENRYIESYEHAVESIVYYLKDAKMNEILSQWFSQPRFQDFVVYEEILAAIPW